MVTDRLLCLCSFVHHYQSVNRHTHSACTYKNILNFPCSASILSIHYPIQVFLYLTVLCTVWKKTLAGDGPLLATEVDQGSTLNLANKVDWGATFGLVLF